MRNTLTQLGNTHTHTHTHTHTYHRVICNSMTGYISVNAVSHHTLTLSLSLKCLCITEEGILQSSTFSFTPARPVMIRDLYVPSSFANLQTCVFEIVNTLYTFPHLFD